MRLCTRKQKLWSKQETNTQILTWKPKWGKKTTAVHKLQNTLWERNTTTRIHRGNDLLSSSSPHAAATVEATTSHSLSLSHVVSVHTRYTQTYKSVQQLLSTTNLFFALSHIYTYMTFGLFTHVSLPIGRTDRNRVFGLPVLHNFHPEGPVSQQKGR